MIRDTKAQRGLLLFQSMASTQNIFKDEELNGACKNNNLNENNEGDLSS